MKRSTGVSLALVLAMLGVASGADTAISNTAEWTTPQLSANTNVGAEIPMARELERPAAPSKSPAPLATPAVAQSRNIWAVMLAILALLVTRFVFRRLRSRSDSS